MTEENKNARREGGRTKEEAGPRQDAGSKRLGGERKF